MDTVLFFKTVIKGNTFYLLKEGNEYIFISSDQHYQHLIRANQQIINGSIADFDDVIAQLQCYFLGHIKQLNIPFKYSGTPFQQQVWNALYQIPYGETRTYKEIAKTINNEKAVRTVASAIGKNPLLLVIPCHRVIGSDNRLHGFRGGLLLKQSLLDLERNTLKNEVLENN